MRLLHFLPVYAPAWQFGGPVLSVSRLCEGLAAAGAEVEVITTNAGLPDWPPEQLGVPLWHQGVRVVHSLRGALKPYGLGQGTIEEMPCLNEDLGFLR